MWYLSDAIDSQKEVIKLASEHVFTFSDLKKLSATIYCTKNHNYVATPLLLFILENVEMFKYIWNKQNAYARLSEIFEQNGFVYRYTKLFSKHETETEGYWTNNTQGDEFVYGIIGLQRLKELSSYNRLEILGKKNKLQEFFDLLPFDEHVHTYNFNVIKIYEHIQKHGTQSLANSVLKIEFVFGNEHAVDYDNRVIEAEYRTGFNCTNKII